MKDKIDLIMLNWNGLEYSKMLVDTLFRNTSHPFNLIVVDNASSQPGTKEYFNSLIELNKNVIVHYSKVEDSGVSEGCNIGLKYSESPYVGFINNDIIVPPNPKWLDILIEDLKKDPVGAVSCKLVYPNRTIQFGGGLLVGNAFSSLNCFYHRGRYNRFEEYSFLDSVSMLTFAFVILKKEVLGQLDETYRRGYFEDNDKCMDLLSRGYELLYDGRVFLYHYESRTTLTLDPNIISQSQFLNAILFRKRWLPFIWEDLQKRPRFWGWTEDGLGKEIERYKLSGGLWYQNRRLTYEEWNRIVGKERWKSIK